MELQAKEVRLIYFLIEYQCEKCNDGNMVNFDDVKSSLIQYDGGVIKFKHVCTNCSGEEYFTKKYPFLIHNYQT